MDGDSSESSEGEEVTIEQVLVEVLAECLVILSCSTEYRSMVRKLPRGMIPILPFYQTIWGLIALMIFSEVQQPLGGSSPTETTFTETSITF